MFTNSLPSEQISSLANIAPVSQGVGAVTTGWVPVANHHVFLALICTGLLGASATVDAKIQQATDAAGTGAKDVTGKAITQIVKATGDNKQAMINFRPTELDTNGGFGYVRLSLTVGTAASLVSAELLGFNARNNPASINNQAAVVQLVN